MKKFYFIWLFTVLLIGSQIVMADVVTTTRRIQKPTESTQQVQSSYSSQTRVKKEVVPVTTRARLSNSVKSCKKYSETLDSSISGVDFNFKISILGWVDNKCRVDFEANSTGINEMFSLIHGMDPSMAKISSFEPNVRCEFTKEQLVRVGDSILQEEEREQNGSSKMLKNPGLVTIKPASELSGSDAALMDVILREGACTILNAPDSNAIFESLFNF